MKNTFILICLFMITGALKISAQTFTIKGDIKATTGEGIPAASVSLKATNYRVICDADGHYQLKNIKPGNYTLVVSAVSFKSIDREIKVNADLTMDINLEQDITQLKDVEVKAEKEKTFGVTRLKAVEGTTINAGKKSEVIVLGDQVANAATNNTRQIYSKVAGLNIWENDGAGIQLSIGGRGLSPNRVTNFNTRQNGYDISADALGYPESYYSPTAELLDRIEILRGAASLQYGTQFGGIINFQMKEGPKNTPFEFTSRETVGSWNFLNFTNSIGGTVKKVQYYVFFQHKQGDDWRPNSQFNVNLGYTSVTYKPTDKFTLTFQYTFMDYLAHQPGGLTDDEFAADPHQSVRARNWFKVNWNLGAVLLDYQINNNLKFNSRFFGLSANRDALGNLNFIYRPDAGGPRDLYRDKYLNYGNESRLLYTYNLNGNPQNLLFGLRYYKGNTDRQQGQGNDGSTGKRSDFNFIGNDDSYAYSKYKFPNYNVALFAENIFRLTPKFSIIPGLRYENIITKADGFYTNTRKDGAGNIFFSQKIDENKDRRRHFLIGGIGLSYYKSEAAQFYANISQNYRGINFNDFRSANQNRQTNPNLSDEKGYSADLGFRGNINGVLNYDVSVFYINYNNRIGTILRVDSTNNVQLYRTNVSQSRNLGLESFAELELLHFINKHPGDTKLSVFSNLALINARYVNSKEAAYEGKKVELAPSVIFKTGLNFQYQHFKANYQLAYTSSQFTDATNAVLTTNAIDGLVPAYTVMDFSAQYDLSKILTLEGSVNNLADKRYFTRRADSYPGPGIIPANARSYFLTLQVKL
ncbi:TonB-dependent receptor [Mucilaginibacter sp. CAU 1740]|uniref:TonB-dependent receptor domain-containing protein n=1 Tax=Mucilaginibacter sp. CAU 1740 TaxID=3140365 RepID=UPI00325B5BBF